MSAFAPMTDFNPAAPPATDGYQTHDYHLCDKQIVDVVITHASLDTPPADFDRPARVRLGVRVPDGPARGYSWFFNLNILSEGDAGLRARQRLQALGYFSRTDGVLNALKAGRVPSSAELEQLKGSRQRVMVSQFVFRDGKNAGTSYQGANGILDSASTAADSQPTRPLMAVRLDHDYKPTGQPYALTESAQQTPAPVVAEEDLPF